MRGRELPFQFSEKIFWRGPFCIVEAMRLQEGEIFTREIFFSWREFQREIFIARRGNLRKGSRFRAK